MKKQYQSPALKVVEIKVERGFQVSGGSFSLNTTSTQFEMIESENGPRNEAYDFSSENFWN